MSNVSHFRVFGSICWYVIPHQKLHKLDAHARSALMMVYSLQSNGYKLWDIELQKFTASRHLAFQEVYSADITHAQLLNTTMEPEIADSSSNNDNTKTSILDSKTIYSKLTLLSF